MSEIVDSPKNKANKEVVQYKKMLKTLDPINNRLVVTNKINSKLSTINI